VGTEDIVRGHYRRDGLEAVVLDALRRAGADLDALRVEDLAGLDQLHAGGVPATEHLLDALALSAGTTLLDVGAGVGGPARWAAARHGCRVTGVDLSPDFVGLATALTSLVGLADVVSFDVGSATSLPYGDATFARAMLVHVGMNIPDKAAVFAEVRRVLEPAGRFAVFDQMRVAEGALTFPVPWADDERSSFVEGRGAYAELLTAAGFSIERDEDCLGVVAGPGPSTGLTPADLFGDGFTERMGNNIAATMNGLLRPVLMVAHAA
jgi:SAM-dependent methyltransferase